jgi:transposase
VVRRARSLNVLAAESRCAVDATGLESRYVSQYYVLRVSSAGAKRYPQFRYPKLTVAWDIDCHIGLSAHVCMGPTMDSPQFRPVVVEAAQRQRLAAVLADKGYDAEHNHVLCREDLEIATTMIAVRRGPKGSRRWPRTKYRRQMKSRSNREGYGQRWQAESAFSMHKRVLGAALRARAWAMQRAEILLRLLTHDVMILAGSSAL